MPETRKVVVENTSKKQNPHPSQAKGHTNVAHLSEESGEVRDDGNDQNQVMSRDGGVDNSMGNNKLDLGLDCSDIDYFNIMKSGGRVTRNRIRKEK